MLKKKEWRTINYKLKSFGALMTNLSKAFGNRVFKNCCLSREFLVVRLTAYGFGHTAFKLI